MDARRTGQGLGGRTSHMALVNVPRMKLQLLHEQLFFIGDDDALGVLFQPDQRAGLQKVLPAIRQIKSHVTQGEAAETMFLHLHRILIENEGVTGI